VGSLDSEVTDRSGDPRLCIIADDFTGAADAGAPFAASGFKTCVFLPRRGSWALEDAPAVASTGREDSAAEVLVLDTESRFASPSSAAAAVKAAARFARSHGFFRFFKKVDSTLRGNVGAELLSSMDVLEVSRALLAPAFPEQGRTIRNGICYVHGVALGETEVAHDPKNPATFSNVSEILRSSSDGYLRVVVVDPADYADVRDLMVSPSVAESPGIGENRKTVVLANAWKRAHLARLAEMASELPGSPLLAGSAGLTRHLAKGRRETAAYRGRPSGPAVRTSGVLVVAGSLSKVSSAQIDFVEATVPGTVRFELGSKDVDQRLAKEALASGCVVVLSTSNRHSIPNASVRLAERVSSLVSTVDSVSNSATATNLLIVGGDTAVTILRCLEIECLELTGEPLPGIASGHAFSPYGRVNVVTKAGAFGNRNTLAVLLSVFPGRS
jgi:D-threonate/D-erythronate kinase